MGGQVPRANYAKPAHHLTAPRATTTRRMTVVWTAAGCHHSPATYRQGHVLRRAPPPQMSTRGFDNMLCSLCPAVCRQQTEEKKNGGAATCRRAQAA